MTQQKPDAESKPKGQAGAAPARGQARAAPARAGVTPAAAAAGGAASKPAPTAPPAAHAAPQLGEGAGLGFVLDIPLRVTVEIGSARLLLREVMQLDKGSVIELDRMVGEPADVLVNGRLVARGEITAVDDRFSVRVVEIVGGGTGAAAGGSGSPAA